MNYQICSSLSIKGEGHHHLILSFIIITVTSQQLVSPRVLIILSAA